MMILEVQCKNFLHCSKQWKNPIRVLFWVNIYREAAKECRRKKKEYVKCLENRVAVLENQNRTLIEELKSLKELYCQKDAHS
jgi:bZIP transcription factor